MDDPWRFRPLQSNPSFPHPYPPPPHPSLHPPPFHRPLHDPPPFVDHRTIPPFPAREPLPPPRFPHEDDFFVPKRMRVDDPIQNPFPQRLSPADEWRLNLIRDHGQDHQNTPPPPSHLPPYRIGPVFPQEPAPFPENPRFLPQERNGFEGFGIGDTGRRSYQQYDSQIARIEPPPYRRYDHLDTFGEDRSIYYPRPPISYSALDYREIYHSESYKLSDSMGRPEEQPLYYPRPRISFQTESSSYGLQPKQPPQPHHSSSYHMMANTDNFENEIMYQRPQENKVEHLQVQHYQEEIWKPSEPELYRPIGEDFRMNDYRLDRGAASRVHTFETFPPLPPQPPLPPPPEPSPPQYQVTPSAPMPSSVLNHVPATTLETPLVNRDSSQGPLEARPSLNPSFYSEPSMHSSSGFATERLPFTDQTPSKEHLEGRHEAFGSGRFCEEKSSVIDACHLFRQPHRSSRPDHFVIILRGLPGSGKSYLAKTLRNLEVEAGGNAPRIHALDDYFMIEVEKVEDSDGPKSTARGKKQLTKKVIEYCYEPEMEEVYRSSMLKAFKKTLDEGSFTFVIVDDRNLRVADFAQFWAIAKRSGYEVYVLEATYTDPVGCAARNVHGFTVDDIEKMAKQWEDAPPLYLQLDIKSLFRGDDLNEQSILEVDMDTDDAVCGEEETNKLQQEENLKKTDTKILDSGLDTGSAKIGERWNAEEEEYVGVNKLGSSKWSKDEGIENSDATPSHLTALSGLVQAYGKGEKSVHWGDHADRSGFSIGVLKKQLSSSLIIGPGSGYNLISNPLPVEEDTTEASRNNGSDSKRRFSEQLRAERESFKAVLDRRRQRVGVLWDVEDE